MAMESARETTARPRAVPRRDEKPLPPDATDGELLARVGQRDHEAFEVLYRRYVRPVFGLALRRLRDRQRAEDAVQATFAAVWRSAASYRPERGAATAWLYAVAGTPLSTRCAPHAEPPSEAPDLDSAEPGPPDRAEAAFVAWRVHRALEELPDRERDVIQLAYWSDMSQSEVAEYLHIPLGTVKTRTRSALARLASTLDGGLI
jgi:RNA polymerase sigma-70 factor (ECF subfamily)